MSRYETSYCVFFNKVGPDVSRKKMLQDQVPAQLPEIDGETQSG